MWWHFELDEHPRRKFIPTVEELNRSYGIQNGSPARLTTAAIDLELDITRPREHTRVISEAELSMPSSNSIPLSSSQPMADHLSLPCLSRLSGEWTIYDNVMQQLLTKTLSKVEQFYLQLWTMNTLESLLRVLRAKARNYDDNGNEPLAFFITNPL
ncbi:hypothetical protein KI688_010362 [Linnemannia hyalina]|uniref:Uncharacterized protein n=1 Tax=Linnemannia hyalina TaxID=64524 RepID=A0A9P8BV56_9FUNG|nr:hypothetical protein KI688_010362 [Linnemannia hyalina]